MRASGGPVWRGFRFVGLGPMAQKGQLHPLFELMPSYSDLDIEVDEETFEGLQQHIKFDPPKDYYDAPKGAATWRGMRIFLIEKCDAWRDMRDGNGET